MAWTVFLIPIVALISVFTFVAVATWSDNRRKEREAFYRHETYQKMLERSEGSAEEVRALIQEEQSRLERRWTERLDLGLKLGGLVLLAASPGLGVFLYFLERNDPIYLVALIPLLVGAVLALFGFYRSSRHPAGAAGSR